MQEFLSAILAGEGHYCITGIKSGEKYPVIQSFFSKIEETNQAIQKFLGERRDVYFALATFKDPKAPKPRAQDNVQLIKSLWVDIDCGEDKAKTNKGYATKEEAIEALAVFLEETKLPDPIIVDSGGGVHVYWPFSRALSREEWQSLADGLKELCFQKRLLIDEACTADAARILRVPGTYNFKEEDPRPVRLLAIIEQPYDPDVLKELLPKVENKSVRPIGGKKEPSELTIS